MTKQQRNIRERWITFKRIISIIASFLFCKKRLKRVWWFMYKKYFLKNTLKTIRYIYIYIYINKVEEKKII